MHTKMASKDEVPPMGLMTLQAKREFFKDCFQKHNELTKYQREYKNELSMRLKTRAEVILEKSCVKQIDRLQNERNDLRAQIWVANGRCYKNENQRGLEQVSCHIKCQERLSEEIKNLKVNISNLERQKACTEKQIYELNRKTIPDQQHQGYVERSRKRKNILENRLEVGVRRECKFTAMNTALRQEMKTLYTERELFNRTYTSVIQKLIIDKKYLMDLLEYATNVYEGAIDVNEKIANAKLRAQKESEQNTFSVQSTMRKMASAELVSYFFNCKNQIRIMADLQPNEYRRREAFKRKHVHKIQLYNNVLKQIFEFSEVNSIIDAVIDKYQYHESLYYTYFSYANETSFHVTLLENAVENLYEKVGKTRQRNHLWSTALDDKISKLESTLEDRVKRNKALNDKLMTSKKDLDYLLQVVAKIFNMCLADAKPLTELLGDQSLVDIHNMRAYLKILEKRIVNLVCSVYILERKGPYKSSNDYIVKNIEKMQELPTPLNDIVLTQQCPECAEIETFNIDDGGEGGVHVTSLSEAKAKLFEAVNQPEMQYRLHNISHCRLPRSRLLGAKRNS